MVYHLQKKDQHTLSFPAKETGFQKLVEIIEPVLIQIPSMRYKLNEVRKEKYFERLAKKKKPRND